MKKMILAISFLSFISSDVYSQCNKLNRSDKRFIKNVIKVQKEKPVEITKRDDNHIVVEFNTTMVVLKPDGFIGEMWIRTDADWERLPQE